MQCGSSAILPEELRTQRWGSSVRDSAPLHMPFPMASSAPPSSIGWGAITSQKLSLPLPGTPWMCDYCGNTRSVSGCPLFAVRELRVQGTGTEAVQVTEA